MKKIDGGREFPNMSNPPFQGQNGMSSEKEESKLKETQTTKYNPPTKLEIKMKTDSNTEGGLLSVPGRKRSRLTPSPVTRSPPSVADVKKETARILEEFLKCQLEHDKKLNPRFSTEHQLVRDEETTERIFPPNSSRSDKEQPKKSPTDSKKGHRLSLSADNYRFYSLERSHEEVYIKSPEPEEYKTLTMRVPGDSAEDSLDKTSKSGEHSFKTSSASKYSILSLEEEIERMPFADEDVEDDLYGGTSISHSGRSCSLPPSSDLKNKEYKGSFGKSASLIPIGTQSGKQTNVEAKTSEKSKNNLGSVPDSVDESSVLNLFEKASIKTPQSPDVGQGGPKIQTGLPLPFSKSRHRSGSISSSDTENEDEVVPRNRKKKSLFQRARDHFNILLHRKERESKDLMKGNLVSSTHRHKHGHIEQHHYDRDGKKGILLTTEEWEKVDIDDEENRQHKQIDKHTRGYESADLSTSEGASFVNSLRRLSLRKLRDKHMPRSKSSDSIKKKKKRKRRKSGMSEPDGNLETLHIEKVKEDHGGNWKKTSRHNVHAFKDEGLDVGIGSIYQNLPAGIVTSASSSALVGGRKSFVVEYDVEESESRERLPTGEMKIKTNREIHRFVSDSEGDKKERPLSIESSVDGKSTEQGESNAPTQEEKEKLYTHIAQRIAEIGDGYKISPALSWEESSSPVEAKSSEPLGAAVADPRDSDGLNSLERQLRDVLREAGDNYNEQNPEASSKLTGAAIDMLRQTGYNGFSDVVSQAVGDRTGWHQVAFCFNLISAAVKVAGKGGALASNIKEMSVQYVMDKYASWIVDQGGWDSVLENSDSELD